jgi:hypothetical protein
MLLIGLNNDSTKAAIHGKAVNPFLPKPKSNGPILIVVIFLLVMFVIALACFIKAKKNERDRIVTFAPTEQTNAKKTYRNGVEVKPSELDRGSRQDAINSSVNEEREETLLDNENENE